MTLSASISRVRRHLRGLVFCGLALTAIVLIGTSRTLPHLFPQFVRPLWGTLGIPLKHPAPPELADLPAIYYDAKDHNGPIAIVLSGNGGWWGLCDKLAKRLEEQHVSTIGLNSLAYFVSPRTPTGIARDLDRMARAFDAHRPIMLIGYSYGADVVATVYNELDPKVRARIQLVSLMGLTKSTNYAIGFWQVATPTRHTAKEVAKISGPTVQCFVGTEEGKISACHALDPQKVEIVELPGGHHFGGDYTTLAHHVMDSWKRRVAAHINAAPAPG